MPKTISSIKNRHAPSSPGNPPEHCCEISTKVKFLKSLSTGLEMVLPCDNNNGRTGKPAGSPTCSLINKLRRRLLWQSSG